MTTDLFSGMSAELRRHAKRLIDMGYEPHKLGTGAVRLDPPADQPDLGTVRIPMKKNPSNPTVTSLKTRVDKIERRRKVPAVAAAMISAREAQMDRMVADVVDPVVVSESPWMAAKVSRRNGGVKYESKAVVERKWSDGRVEYLCAYESCDYTSEKARSVSNHYGASHSSERPATQDGPQYIDPEYTEPMTHYEYEPSSRLVGLLTAQISAAVEAGWTPTQIAQAILKWMHDRPDLGSVEHRTRPTVDMTPEQILERIRLLVDSGRTMKLEESVARLESELADAQLKVDRLLEERSALRELLS